MDIVKDDMPYSKCHAGTPFLRNLKIHTTQQISILFTPLQKYYVPPLIFSHNNLRLMNEKMVCIDGKQRCTSIVRFMDGEIPFVSPETKEKFWFKDGPGKRKLLPIPLRRHFEQVNLPAVTYKELGEEQQRDIFRACSHLFLPAGRFVLLTWKSSFRTCPAGCRSLFRRKTSGHLLPLGTLVFQAGEEIHHSPQYIRRPPLVGY